MGGWKSFLLSMVLIFYISQVSESRHADSKISEKGTNQVSKLHHTNIKRNKPSTGLDRQYKIYTNNLTWSDAAKRCEQISARLVKFHNNEEFKSVLSSLRIGRAKTAWIDSIGDTKSHKNKNCLMLKQGINGFTWHNTSQCNILRPYMCSKHNNLNPTRRNEAPDEDEEILRDVLREYYGYRIFYDAVPWISAQEQCEEFKKDYDGKMVELRDDKILNDLKHIMSRNLLALNHIWLGGTYDNNKWYWISDHQEIRIDLIHEWVRNSSYQRGVEYLNTCLNMDMVEFNEGSVYGTICSYPQPFVCMFPLYKFEQLLKDEEKSGKKFRLRILNKSGKEKGNHGQKSKPKKIKK